MLRTILLSLIALSPVGTALAARPARLAKTTDLVLHFSTSDRDRRAVHALPLSRIAAVKGIGDGEVAIDVGGTRLYTKAIRVSGPKGEIAPAKLPVLADLSGQSGAQIAAAIAKQNKLQLGPMPATGPTRAALLASHLDRIEPLTELAYSYNPNFSPRKEWAKVVPLGDVERVYVKAGSVNAFVAAQGSRPLPSSERTIRTPWERRATGTLSSFWKVMDNREQLTTEALADYLSGRTNQIEFSTRPTESEGLSGTQIANVLRARLVRDLTELGVQRVEWPNVASALRALKLKTDWAL